jgi:hypothetical protein
MTTSMRDLLELLEKTSASGFLREIIGFTARRLMDIKVETLTGAAHGSRGADRLTHRNGYCGFCQRSRQPVRLAAVGLRYILPPVGSGTDAVYGMRLVAPRDYQGEARACRLRCR